MNGRDAVPIRRKLKSVVLGLMLLLLTLQLFMQSFFMNAMRQLYMDKTRTAMEQAISDIQELMRQQSDAVEHIAGEADILLYAAERNSGQRYHMAYANAQPIVRSATQNLSIDHMLIYDNSSAWYQFMGGLPYNTARVLRDTFASITNSMDEAIVVDGSLFLCAVAPLMSVAHGRFAREGLVLSLVDARTIQRALTPRAGDGTILLHDGNTILLSSNAALQGLPLYEGPVSDRHYYVTQDSILPNLHMTVSIPTGQIFPKELPYLLAFAVTALFSLLTLLLILWLSARWFTRPLSQVLAEMADINREGKRLHQTSVSHIDTLVMGINGLLERMSESNARVISAQQTLYETELAHHQTKLMLLLKQIDAHFLYNCLTGIKSLTDAGKAEQAGQMAQSVALLMRYAHDRQEDVNVFDEMSIVMRYIEIMNIRFGGRFESDFSVDDELMGYSMKKMLLQPLVENALVHGLQSQVKNPCLRITGVLQGDTLLFAVEDNGVGIAPERLSAIRTLLSGVDIEYPYMQLKGISLLNIEKRVRSAYGSAYGLVVQSEPGNTRIVLRIPAIPDL